jgi:hypothetical protein
MLRVSEAKTPLLKLDRHHLAFVLACEIEYLKYMSMCKHVSRFDFGKADVDEIILQLSAVDRSGLVRSDCADECVQSYDVIPKYIVKNSTVKYPWFDRELHNVDNNKTKAHKYLKDIAFCCFREFMSEFNCLHRLKYAQYIVRIEGGLKNNPRGFFKYADMKCNADGYPSSMFLGNDCAQDTQSIANLFAEFFQSVYVRDDWIPDSVLPTRSSALSWA